jgi:hypothetical protein
MVLTRRKIKFSPLMMLFRPTIIKAGPGESEKTTHQNSSSCFQLFVKIYYTKIDI